ncbi:MAG: ribose-phosphate diphosphokinase [Candidatus Levybacteria bacterium]|nr:ribose-phosphate diphosphokinase [Candidatus Levybacteria bacterium]
MPISPDIQRPAQSPEELRAKFEPEVILRTDKIEIIAGKGNPKLAQKIAWLVGKDLNEPVTIFADGEKRLKTTQANLRKKGVFIIQSMQPSPDERLMEMYIMIDAVRRASADDIAGVITYPAYMRQDQKDLSRVPISATVPPRILQMLGLNRMLSMELHTGAQQGFFDGPHDIVDSSFVTVPEISSRHLANPIVAAADVGGTKRARNFSRLMGLGDRVIQGDKERDTGIENESKSHGVEGNVRGKDVIIVEDMIDTAGTLVDVAKALKQQGAESIRAVAPYGIFSTKIDPETYQPISAIQRIIDSDIDEIITTNAIPAQPGVVESGKVTYVDIAPMLAEAILCIHTGESISERLILPKPQH